MAVSVVMSYLRLCKRIADRTYFRLRQAIVNITPKGFDGYLDLSNRKHSVFNSVALRLAYVNLVVLYVGCIIKFRMHPVRVSYSVDILISLRILVRLEVYPALEDVDRKSTRLN